MSVPSVITDLSVIAASNSPAGSDSIGPSLDDYLRSVQAIIKREQAQGAAIASSETTAIGGNTDGNYLHITGTTTITSFGTVAAGISRTVVFDGALTLTHSASLILPGGSNITTAAGDAAEFVSEGSGVWRCVGYLRAAGQYLFNGQTATASLAGNLNLSGSGARILGDFSNATLISRALFQTAGINTYTSVGAVPAGSGSKAYFVCYGSSDPDNASAGYVGVDQSAGHILFASTKTGTGTYLPTAFYVSGAHALTLGTNGNLNLGQFNAAVGGARLISATNSDTSPSATAGYQATSDSVIFQAYAYASASYTYVGSLSNHGLGLLQAGIACVLLDTSRNFTLITPTGGLGYGTGAGGTVTQATSKATAVTLNKPTGQITMNTASLAAGAVVTFAVNNSLVNQYDVPVLAIGSVGTGSAYEAGVSYVFNGYFYITLKNITAGALAEAVKINFAIIRGASV